MVQASDEGRVEVINAEGVATIRFFHPKGNSLPGTLLRSLANEVTKIAGDASAKVVVLASEGEAAFCGGASFAELQSIKDKAQGKEFFSGFARLILAMKNCPKFVIARVQSRAVGGGVGLAAAADYALATSVASAKLSELALGIGPFVVGPAVERKVGTAAFTAMTIDYDWRDAAWCKQHGLYNEVYASIPELDAAIAALTKKLAITSPEAMAKLKAIFWQGTEHWPRLLEERAEASGTLVLSDFSRNYIASFSK
ncbi:MAG: enoyl-CoA hydratase/isomerase family protein [Deltaproteobacteria bacterium]|nr:enoyl-CoA hydratase/isomerase family protein [Deltaproteobacteria bacterium]